MRRFQYVVVGASIAGLSAVQAIRSRDLSGEILLIHGEDGLPYKRTELSKRIVKGITAQDAAIFPESWYTERRVQLLRGARAISLDPSGRELALDNEEVVGYDSLLLATGAAPKRLGIPGSEHLHCLRSMDEAGVLTRSLKEAQQAISIGFGVLGVELADQFQTAGAQTVLMGDHDRLMGDHLDLAASRRLESRMTSSGVQVVRCGGIVEIQRKGGEYRVIAPAVEKRAQLVTVSVGASPATELATLAGIPLADDVHRGIKVDRSMRTGVEGIFAAGDVASPLPAASWGLWHSAEAAGAIAGVNMAGAKHGPDPRPYRLKCEVFGGYTFSMNYLAASADDQAQRKVLLDTPSTYVAVWEREGRSIAAVLDLASSPGREATRLVSRRLESSLLDGVSANDIRQALSL
jgi:NAD(P)H-nitrite reductase large subunit